MGTLVFHILLVLFFSISELNIKDKTESEEAILLDLTAVEQEKEIPNPEPEKSLSSDQSVKSSQQNVSNRAVNDAPGKNKSAVNDRFFDANYKQDIEEAKEMVANVNKQLSKKIPAIKKYEMPEATTEGLNPDSVKNVIYSGKSNIHYFLENRFHVRLPIPVYLAKSGGEVVVNIEVDRSGKVVKADVRSSKAASGDPMLTEYALQAAERTYFNSDNKAPGIQKGTITYKFVAQ